VRKESVAPISNFEQGNSSHWAQTSRPLFLKQHVITEHEGCFSAKPSPRQPGHLEEPAV